MAEIKSAIELAMERTRNLVMDEEEKKQSRRKETENRLRAVLRRYMEGMTDVKAALREVDAMEEEKGQKRSILAGLLLEEVDITGDTERLVSLMKGADHIVPRALVEELGGIREDFLTELAKKADIVRAEVTARLAGMGVSGDGIEPNVESWEEWTRAREETGRSFDRRLAEWKEKFARTVAKD